MVCLNTETGKVKKQFESLCREEGLRAKDRDAWIFQNSNLTVDEVRKAPLFSEIRPSLQKEIDKMDFITAFNKSFDFDFLRDRGVSIEKEWPCPMKVATNICKIPHKYGRSGFKWPTVEEAWAHFFPDDDYIEEHRGLDDAKHEALIVHKLYEMGLMMGVEN